MISIHHKSRRRTKEKTRSAEEHGGHRGVGGSGERSVGGTRCLSAVNTQLPAAEQGSRWVTGRNISVCGVTSGDHYVQSERRRKCWPIEIDGSRLLPHSFE